MRRTVCLLVCVFLLSACGAYGPYSNSRMGRQASRTIQDAHPREDHYRAGQELYDKVAEEWRRLEGQDHEIPITLNEEVKASVEYLVNEAPRFMRHSLGRAEKYMPMMKRILREKGLPEDLVYLAMIESGFRTDAVSPAAAVGPWQFISATGRRYGLKIDDFVDERMDPEKSTRAAADYLADLYEMFGSWYLATAAYNCGEGKIQKGLKRFKTDDFWEIAAEKGFLRDETKDYVPRLIAAIIISRDPERYGITGIEPEEPIEYDTVEVSHPTDIEVIARLSGADEDDIRELNPGLKLWCTPLDERDYQVRVPKGKGSSFGQQYARLKPEERMKVSTHVVASGERLKDIAAGFNLSENTLKKFNKLRNNKIKAGQKILLPVDKATYLARKKEYETQRAAKLARLEKSGQKITYTVRSGDSPWAIANKYDIDWKELAAWNNITDARSLKPGQKLVIYLNGGPEDRPVRVAAKKKKPAEDIKVEEKPAPKKKGTTRYVVQSGDTVWKIASRVGCTPEELRQANKLKNNVIRRGQTLKVPGDGGEEIEPVVRVASKPKEATPEKKAKAAPAPEPEPAAAPQEPKNAGTEPVNYTVQKNDTLWKIAARFGVDPNEIRQANKLKGSLIRNGQVLRIGAASAAMAKAAPETPPEPQAKEPEKTAPAEKKPVKKEKAPAAEPPSGTYTVQNGDTLWKIARKFDVSPERIRSANALNGNNIRPGQVLKLDAAAKPEAVPKTKTAAKSKAAPKSEAEPAAKTTSYTVQNGDTLWKIARRFKTDPEKIKSWNSMTNDSIRPGDVLTIKERES